MSGAARSAASPMLALVRQALELADEYVISDIESHGVRVGAPADRRWDVTSMFSEHEHCGQVIDMAERAIAYGLARGFLELETGRGHTLRILRALSS